MNDSLMPATLSRHMGYLRARPLARRVACTQSIEHGAGEFEAMNLVLGNMSMASRVYAMSWTGATNHAINAKSQTVQKKRQDMIVAG